MPKHLLHIEYCLLAGLTDVKMVGIVNDIIDFPNFRYGYRTFRKKAGSPLPRSGMNHNLARSSHEDAELDAMYLQQQPADFRIAYFLHHFLDLYSKHKEKRARTVAECRSWARGEMYRIFGRNRLQGNLLTRCRLGDEFKRAETFFISPKSQFFLEKLPAQRKRH